MSQRRIKQNLALRGALLERFKYLRELLKRDRIRNHRERTDVSTVERIGRVLKHVEMRPDRELEFHLFEYGGSRNPRIAVLAYAEHGHRSLRFNKLDRFGDRTWNTGAFNDHIGGAAKVLGQINGRRSGRSSVVPGDEGFATPGADRLQQRFNLAAG